MKSKYNNISLSLPSVYTSFYNINFFVKGDYSMLSRLWSITVLRVTCSPCHDRTLLRANHVLKVNGFCLSTDSLLNTRIKMNKILFSLHFQEITTLDLYFLLKSLSALVVNCSKVCVIPWYAADLILHARWEQ